jgi:hypothetical protein
MIFSRTGFRWYSVLTGSFLCFHLFDCVLNFIKSHGISKSRVAWDRVDFVEDSIILARLLIPIEYVLFEMVFKYFGTFFLIACLPEFR